MRLDRLFVIRVRMKCIDCGYDGPENSVVKQQLYQQSPWLAPTYARLGFMGCCVKCGGWLKRRELDAD